MNLRRLSIPCLTLLLGLGANLANAQTADALIATGRSFLTNKDLVNANASFAAAVAAAPTNAEANTLYAATRLLVLANAPADKAFLDELGFTSTNRSVYHWTAHVPRDTNGVFLAPTGISASDIAAFLRTNALVELTGAVSNLAAVTSTNFLLNLSSNETALAAVTVDYGDLLLLRSGLHFAEYFLYTLNAWNLDAQLAALRSMLTNHMLKAGQVLVRYPQLLTFATTNDLAAAKAAFAAAVDDYQLASQWIQSRPPGVVRLFNHDPGQKAREHNFVLTLTDLRKSFDQPTTLTVAPSYTVSFGTQFSGETSLRSTFPEIMTTGFVVGTLPDVTFGGLIQGLTEDQVEDFLAAKAQPIPNLTPAPQAEGQQIEIPLRVSKGRGYMLQVSSDLVNWSEVGAFVAVEDQMSLGDALTPAATPRFYRLVDRTANMPPPANDNFANRAKIAAVNLPVTGYNLGATHESTDPPNFTAGRSVWWEWTATQSGEVAVSVIASTFDVALFVYSMPSAGNLQPVQPNPSSPPGQVNFTATAGTTYEIEVDGYPWSRPSAGGVELVITAPPTLVVNAPMDGASYTVPTPVTFNVSTQDSDGQIARVDFKANGRLIGSATQRPYSLVWSNPPPGYYGVMIEATDNVGARADQYLSLQVHPANDDFANRITLSGASVSVAGSNAGASAEPNEPDHGGQPAHASVWYSWTAPAPGSVTVEVQPVSGGYPVLSVYTGSVLSNLLSVAESGLSFGQANSVSATFNAIKGTTYQIAVDGYLDHGSFNLVLAPNSPPTISLVSPVGGQSFPDRTNVILLANAADADGNLDSVLFSVSDTNGFPVFEQVAEQSPYSSTWKAELPGGYTITATALDRLGAATSTSPAQIQILPGPLDQWTTRYSQASGFGVLSGITYGNGEFVAVGDQGTILTSSNGQNWTSRSSGTTAFLGGTTYGNGHFVIVGGNGMTLASTDGLTWTVSTSVTMNDLNAVAVGNGTFVAVGYNGAILTSTNEVNWSSRHAGTTNNLFGVAFGNGVWVVVGDTGTILTSADGVNWSRQSAGTTAFVNSITFGNGQFVAVGGGPFGGQIFTSSNGTQWRSLWNPLSLNGVTYGDGVFVAVGSDNQGNNAVATSNDGLNWITRWSSSPSALDGVTFGNGTFVAVGAGDIILQSGTVASGITP